MGGVTMFPEIDSLPGAKGEAAALDGNGEVHGGEGGTDVGRHVVIAFRSVDEQRVAVGHKTREEGFQVAADIGVGIFLNQKRGGGMPEVEGEEAGLEAGFG